MTLPNYPPLGASFGQSRYLDSWRYMGTNLPVDGSLQSDYATRAALVASGGVVEMGPADAIELAVAFFWNPPPELMEQALVTIRVVRMDPIPSGGFVGRRMASVRFEGQPSEFDIPVTGQQLSAVFNSVLTPSGNPLVFWAWSYAALVVTPQFTENRSGRIPVVVNIGDWSEPIQTPPQIVRCPAIGAAFLRLQPAVASIPVETAWALFARRVTFEAMPVP